LSGRRQVAFKLTPSLLFVLTHLNRLGLVLAHIGECLVVKLAILVAGLLVALGDGTLVADRLSRVLGLDLLVVLGAKTVVPKNTTRLVVGQELTRPVLGHVRHKGDGSKATQNYLGIGKDTVGTARARRRSQRQRTILAVKARHRLSHCQYN
jgi:hypothetical protein